MKSNRWLLGLGSFCFAASALAQDPAPPTPITPAAPADSKLATEGKPAEVKPDDAKPRVSFKIEGRGRSETEPGAQKGNRDLGQLQANNDEIQRRVEQAQADLQRAQRDAQAAQRAVMEAQRELNQRRTATNRGPNGGEQRYYSVVRPYQPHNSFVRTFGLDFVPADPVLRAQLEIPDGEGLVVTVVVPGGLADKAGIKMRDVIAKLDLKPVNDVAQARAAIVEGQKSATYFDLYRAGKPVQVTLSRPERPKSEEQPYYIGVVLAPVDATLRSQVPDLPDDAGLIVTEVVPNGPAARAEAKKNDIIVRVNAHPLKSNEALIEQVRKADGEPIRVEVIRAGKPRTLTVHPERHPVAAYRTTGGAVETAFPVRNFTNVIQQLDLGESFKEINPDSLRSPSTEANARIELEIKGLAEQIEALRKTIDQMGKAPKRGDDAKPE